MIDHIFSMRRLFCFLFSFVIAGMVGCGGSSEPSNPSQSEVEQFLESNPELNKTTPQVDPEPYKL